jgi:uncharacterized protein (TIGR02678 family)
MSPRAVESSLASHRLAERQRALRALLMRPLMTSADPDFVAVRNHADELRLWLLRETGWVLHVERDSARLFKRPADLSDATRGAPGFDRRRYVLLCLACAVLERAEAQITLKNLGDELMRMAADPELAAAGFRFALDQAHERRDLVHVCRFLVSSGALTRVTGDEEAFVQQAPSQSTDALYDVQRRLLSGLLACVRGPSTHPAESEPADLEARLASVTQELVLDSAEARRGVLRHALARRLLDDPVVYLDELDAEAREYFTGQRGPLAARLAEAIDLVAEQRAEGVALVDPDGELSDVQLPAEGTLSHATLLVAEYLAKQLRAEPARFIPEPEVAAFVRGAADSFGRYWRKAEREPGSESALAREALGALEKLRLVSWRDGFVRARPALARYGVGEPKIRAARQLGLL